MRDGVPLEEVAQMRRGASLRASELDRLQTDGAAAARYLNLAGISDCRIQDNLPRLSELEPRLEKYLLQDGDVVVSKSGSPFKVAVARPGRRDKILASGNLYIVRPNKDVLDSDFLAAFLASEVGERNLHHVCVGTSIQSLPIKGLAKIRLPRLPLEKAARDKPGVSRACGGDRGAGARPREEAPRAAPGLRRLPEAFVPVGRADY